MERILIQIADHELVSSTELKYMNGIIIIPHYTYIQCRALTELLWL